MSLVVDTGAGRIKAGLSSDRFPAIMLDNVAVFGKGPGRAVLRRTMQHGEVDDWDELCSKWSFLYKELKIVSDDTPTLLTEAPFQAKNTKEKQCEIFFETLRTPALQFQLQGVLSLYAQGETSGLVLDAGYSASYAIPVCDGFSFDHAVQKSSVGGETVTQYLAELLSESTSVNVTTSHNIEALDKIKRRTCYFSPDFESELVQGDIDYKQVTLPDNTTIEIGPERFSAPEVLFDPSLMRIDARGVDTILLKSLQKTDLDVRAKLASNILLSGGSSMIPSMSDRIQSSFDAALPHDRTKVNAPANRRYSAWVGGAILSELSSFQEQWIYKCEYEENGASAVHRKRTN